ncbi:MAG: LysM peptidoglycan-binding domain-containing protein [Pseudomonadota bacterium]
MHKITSRLSLLALPVLLSACASSPETHNATTDYAPVATSAPLREMSTAPARPVAARPFRDNAPTQYTVKAGDTLWGLARRFLNNPAAWPEIWYNNPQVRNPHLIFPGDQLAIVTIDGKPRLTKKLSPQVRISPLDKSLPTLPLDMLQAFLNYPQALEVPELNDAPQVVGSPDGRLVLGRDDTFHTDGAPLTQDELWAVVRPHKPLIDPVTEEVLGYEAEAVGKALVVRTGNPATLRLQESVREARRGDRLVGLPKTLGQDLKLKHLPENISGMVVSLPDATTRTAQWQIIALNKGRADGMQAGHVIRLHQPGAVVKANNTPITDPRGDTREKDPSLLDWSTRDVTLPDVNLGDAVVFLVYERVSYALITEAERPVRVGDCFSPADKACR